MGDYWYAMGRNVAKMGANLTRNDAIYLAIRALAFISQSGDEISKFVRETGVAPADIIKLSENIEFLGGVLAYLSADESLVAAFSASEQLAPGDVQTAQVLLQGDAG